MRDKRPVDKLSISELERILAMRKREVRMARLNRYEKAGRRIAEVTKIAQTTRITTPDLLVEESTLQATQAISSPFLKEKVASIDFQDTPRFEDEPMGRVREGDPRLAKWGNRILLGIEIAAVFGVILLLYSLFTALNGFTAYTGSVQANAQLTTQAALIRPTATPIINLTTVLPEGHTVALDANGKVIDEAFNLDEIPPQYRAGYQTQLQATYVMPTTNAEGPILIQIPKIGVNMQVVTGDSWEALKLGVGQHIGSANPGQIGNMVLSGHDDVYGEVFRYLDRLQTGDEITVSTLTRSYIYIVQSHQIVAPTDTQVMDSQGSTKQLTLISCYPYQKDTQRIVVFAVLK